MLSFFIGRIAPRRKGCIYLLWLPKKPTNKGRESFALEGHHLPTMGEARRIKLIDNRIALKGRNIKVN